MENATKMHHDNMKTVMEARWVAIENSVGLESIICHYQSFGNGGECEGNQSFQRLLWAYSNKSIQMPSMGV